MEKKNFTAKALFFAKCLNFFLYSNTRAKQQQASYWYADIQTLKQICKCSISQTLKFFFGALINQ